MAGGINSLFGSGSADTVSTARRLHLLPILWNPTGTDTWTPVVLPSLTPFEFAAGINDSGQLSGIDIQNETTIEAVTWIFVTGP